MSDMLLFAVESLCSFIVYAIASIGNEVTIYMARVTLDDEKIRSLGGSFVYKQWTGRGKESECY